MEPIRVKLAGTEYVWFKDKDGSGPLAYLEHVEDVDGELTIKPEHVFSNSYAHVYSDGDICRFGESVAVVADLELLPTT